MSTPPPPPAPSPGQPSEQPPDRPSDQVSGPPPGQPPGQPSGQPVSPYQAPQPTPGAVGGSVGGYGTPVPTQHNPYAQAGPYGPQPPYAGGPGAPGAPGVPGGQPGYGPGFAPGSFAATAGRRGGAGRAVLWAVVGAAVASVLWGGGVLLLGSGSDSANADLRGYKVPKKMCAATDLTPFKKSYPKTTDSFSAIQYTAKGKTLDETFCEEGLEMDASTYSDAYLSVQVELNRAVDPAPEFADTWLGWKQHVPTYKVEPVKDLGDEAYLVTQDTVKSTTSSGSRYVTLAVRDGWMTYSMTWNAFPNSTSSDTLPTIAQATEWVRTATDATLANLKK